MGDVASAFKEPETPAHSAQESRVGAADEHQGKRPPAPLPAPAGSAALPPHAESDLRAFLAGYDAKVHTGLARARAAASGLERVQVMHNEVRPSLVVHDALVESVLCPLLEPLPGGPEVAQRLREGCKVRARLIERFSAVSNHVAARNVYPVAGAEVDDVLESLEQSFAAHARDETERVSELLQAAEKAVDPVVIASAMALQARRVPTRHAWASSRLHAGPILALRRWQDRLEDWSDSHWGWAPRPYRSPREELSRAMKQQAGLEPPSVRNVLEGYDAAVEMIVDELGKARTPEERARAARRVAAAIAIHDAVVGGTLCPLLEAVPAGKEVAARLRAGCAARAALQRRFEALAEEARDALLLTPNSEAAKVIDELIESFSRHEHEGTIEVESILSPLPPEAYRTASSPLDDVMWPWHSEGPAILALRMALWSEAAPTRSHPALLRHPTSRTLRSLFHLIDHYRDHWRDTWLARWFLPELPPRAAPSTADATTRAQSSAFESSPRLKPGDS
jgi:hypothetical protein